MYLCVYRLI